MKKRNYISLGVSLGLLGFAVGCQSDDAVTPNATTAPVSLSAGFSKIGANTSFLKTAAVDSLKIDSIIAVFQKIKFESHIESAVIDSTGKDSTVQENEANITFKGPFILHIRDTNSVSFADQTLPAGIYTGIKFKIHTLHNGDKYEDSDIHNHRLNTMNMDSMMGYSIGVWGSVKQNGTWVRFSYKSAIEVEYKIIGNFTVAGSSSVVPIALRFNTAAWFKDVRTGVLLDPTVTTSDNKANINEAIRKSFEKGSGGKDSNNDGHPDA